MAETNVGTANAELGWRNPRDGTARVFCPWATTVLIGCGGLALAMGLLVYMADRDSAHALLFPTFATLHTGALFGAVGFWLPSFVHPFAFSLFTAALLPRAAMPTYVACAAWWAVNVAFEFGQHPRVSGAVADALLRALGDTELTRAVSNYFVLGSFDVADVAAATAGACAAAALLCAAHRWEDRHAH